MVLPSIMVELGRAVEIKTIGGAIWEFPKSGKFVVCSTVSGIGKLFIISKVGAKRTAKNNKKGEKLRTNFTGKEGGANQILSVTEKKLMKLGTCKHIVYESDKFEPKFFHYIHEFEKKPFPFIEVDSLKEPGLMVLNGKHIRVTERGILG